MLAVSALLACRSSARPAGVDTTQYAECKGHRIACDGTVAVRCEDGQEVPEDCEDKLQVCSTAFGCVTCPPGESRCEGETTQTCSADGQDWIDGEVCPGTGGVHCDMNSGKCSDLCAVAARDKSYVGCEYWSITAANVVNKEFDFAVIVSNAQGVPAQVHITAAKSDTTAALDESHVVMPGTLETFRLPWRLVDGDDQLRFSDTAYRVTSSVPVTAYQFNPLEYRFYEDCKNTALDSTPDDGACHSFTNDASLLLPTATLGSTYLVVAPSTARARRVITDRNGATLNGADGEPLERNFEQLSTVTLVAVADTTVTIVPSAQVLCSEGTFEAGDKIRLKLKQGEAAQLFFQAPASVEDCAGRHDEAQAALACGPKLTDICQLEEAYCEGADPTGTRITSTAAIAVYVGSPCSFVPYSRRACDHLEEALPPLDTWGKQVVVGITHPLLEEPNVVRIASAVDGNKLTFDPPEVHDAVTLDAGAVVELETRTSFKVEGTQPLLVAQFLVGQDYDDLPASVDSAQQEERSGDPSLSFAPPVEQYRRDFEFLTPETYDSSWITVVAPADAGVSVDDYPMYDWEPIGDSGFVVGHQELKPGPHRVRADLPVAVQVYGFGAYTSYMFPAGLNLDRVNELL